MGLLGRLGRLGRLKKAVLVSGAGLLLLWWFSIPPASDGLFDRPFSTVLEAEDGELLGARIAPDGQWRFPPSDSVPRKFELAICSFEDARFRLHPGVDPLALARAVRQNLAAGRVVSGASTLTMQTIRLASDNPPRTVLQKLWEMFRATRLEARLSKDDILGLYADNAPFGGNVVGLQAASWRYFGMDPHRLSWSESAALAVLPNAPSIILPGRNVERFRKKRDRLLDRLLALGHIDSTTCRLSKIEPLPGAPQALPELASHALNLQKIKQPQLRVRSTLNAQLQLRVQGLVDAHVRRWKGNEVHNAAALVIELQTGEIKAYVGNTSDASVDGSGFDMLRIPRSTGSILKPFLYSLAMDEGMLTSRSLVEDIPTRFGDFTPHNFDRRFLGAVTVEQALQQSLNVPAARLLRRYNLHRFYDKLQALGFDDLTRPARHYGLTLILGGAEIRPAQFAAGLYAWVHRALPGPTPVLRDLFGTALPPAHVSEHPVSVYNTLQMMRGLKRPTRWKDWQPARPVAWKTGTSYGFRDAWAVGTDGRWLVVIWTGNANNEGRPGLIGVQTSAPLFFSVLAELECSAPLPAPDLAASQFHGPPQRVALCGLSGYTLGPHCHDTTYLRVGAHLPLPCRFCRTIQLDPQGRRVNNSCAQDSRDTSWMVLPPAMQWYHTQAGGRFAPLPAWSALCTPPLDHEPMAWIYPSQSETVRRTRDFDGAWQGIVLEIGHRDPAATIFWYDNETYLGTTTGHHQLSVNFTPGAHQLLAIDNLGARLQSQLLVVD